MRHPYPRAGATFGDQMAARVYHDPNTGCWLFDGAAGHYGHARVFLNGCAQMAHRASWEWHNQRPIPSAMIVCHKCDTPPCVNPDHLFLGSPRDNTLDMFRKGRSKAPRVGPGDVPSIVSDYLAGCPIPEIAARYGVKGAAISNILRGISWREVDVPRPRAGMQRGEGVNRRPNRVREAFLDAAKAEHSARSGANP